MLPLVYYWFLKRFPEATSWSFYSNESELPEISVIVPTYNEETLIEGRLNNIYEQDYPKHKLRIIVVDSASTDKTVEFAERWASHHKDVDVRIVQESVRRGKPHALNNILPIIETELLVVTDADCLWSKDALRNCVKYFQDPKIGVVSGVKTPLTGSHSSRMRGVETAYRSFYNEIRLLESRVHCTPVISGEFFAARKELLIGVGGFDLVNDDSYTAMKMVLRGYRAIVADDIKILELMPKSMRSYSKWKVVRAQHLLHNFSTILRKIHKYPQRARIILTAEAFLHLVNPWLLFVALPLFILSLVRLSLTAISILALLALVLAIPKTRQLASTWITQQLLLIIASIKNLWTKSEVWEKIEEIRKVS